MDTALGSELERWLLRQLQGNEKEPGLYHTLAHGVPTWDVYQNLTGRVHAYESVLREIYNIGKKMREGGEEERVVLSRSSPLN